MEKNSQDIQLNISICVQCEENQNIQTSNDMNKLCHNFNFGVNYFFKCTEEALY